MNYDLLGAVHRRPCLTTQRLYSNYQCYFLPSYKAMTIHPLLQVMQLPYLSPTSSSCGKIFSHQ